MATVIITGANGSLAIPSVKYLLSKHPTYTAVLTVRDENDQNTQRLREVISSFPSAKTEIRTLDLSSLSATKSFASEVKAEISTGKLPPLKSIICNAFTWSINGGLVFTSEGYERTIVVNYLAHLSLVLRLLDSFGPEGGRITFLSSDSHYPGKNGLEKFPPTIPDNLELLVKPNPDTPGEEVGRGFQRYGISKLAVVMGMYQLNARLAKDPALSKITAVAMDPGGLPDSRCMNEGVPKLWTFMMKRILGPLQPIMKYAIPTLRSVDSAAVDLIEISVGEKEASGYYTMMERDSSSPESYDEEKQRAVWAKSLEWTGITEDQIALKTAFQ